MFKPSNVDGGTLDILLYKILKNKQIQLSKQTVGSAR